MLGFLTALALWLHFDEQRFECLVSVGFFINEVVYGMLDQVCRELRCVRVPNSPSPLAPFR